MKKLLGILFAGILGLHGCGDEPVKPQAKSESEKAAETTKQPPQKVDDKTEQAQEQAQDSRADYTPALWKVEHQGATSYLFGSVHVGKADMYPLPNAVSDAFESSDTLVVEIDMNDINQMQLAKKVQDLALALDNPLDTVLSEETLQEYNEYCEETQSPCQMLNSFEPWYAAITLEALSMQQSGYQEQYGIDVHFLNKARDTKDIVELESIDSQLETLDGMPLKLQDVFLYSVVAKDDDEMDELFTAWKAGRVEEYVENSFEEAQDMGIAEEDYNHFIDILLHQRNQGMADGIAQQLEQGKSLFVVVGAAHYGGDKSVNHYLEEKGYKIERVDY